MVKAIKYRFQSDLSTIIPSLITKTPANLYINSFLPKDMEIIPIPLHAERERFRGFNQAKEIGKIVAQNYNVPIRHDMIQRIKTTLPQVQMKSREERIKNMKGVFTVPFINQEKLPKKILLVDDVFTTGTTMREASAVMKHNGAEFVWGITLAR